MHITKSKLDKLTFPSESQVKSNQVRFYDDSLKGFGIRITKNGTKSFFIEKGIKGKLRRKTLGRYPELTVESARREAHKYMGQIATGLDPFELERCSKLRAITLEAVFQDYLNARKALKATTIKDYQRLMKESFSDWRSKPLLSVTKNMITNRHEELGKRSQARANLSMRFLRALFNFAAGQYDDETGKSLFLENPIKRLSHTRAWYRVARRQTVIQKHELPKWFKAVYTIKKESIRTRAEVTCNYLLFILFTGLRRSEAARLKWLNINLDASTFTIEETKNHQKHTLPLTSFTHEILEKQFKKRMNDYVFSSFTGKGHIAEPRKIMKKITEISGVSFTLHDLRRTFITIAESLDIPAYALKRLLNHKSNNSDITGGYIIMDVERLRNPMEKISNHLQTYTPPQNQCTETNF